MDIITTKDNQFTFKLKISESLANSIRSMFVMTTSQKDNMIMNGKKYAKKEFDRATLIKLLESWMVEYSQKNISKKIK